MTKLDLALKGHITSMNKTSDVLPKYFVYVLIDIKDNRFYVGLTHNIEHRLKEHTSGNVESTKNRRPLKLIHYEYFLNEEDAKAREVFLKSGFGRSQLKFSLKRTLKYFSNRNAE